MNPFFSIITPVYNSKEYLQECIDSVINQTFTSWELILVDDGSTDGSGEICDTYLSDSRIKVIHQANAGAFKSRINGIEAASGAYMLGLDADDLFEIDCLEKIKNAITLSNSDLILFGYHKFGNADGNCVCTLKPMKQYTTEEILAEVIETTNHSLWDKAIRLDKVRQADYSGIKKNLSINLDYAQIIPILCNIDTGYILDDVLYHYRVYESSVSHSCRIEHIFDTELVSEYVIQKLTDANLISPAIYDKVYLAYLKMIGPRLFRLFSNRTITKEDCKNIHKSNIYIRSKKVETLRNFSVRHWRTLKFFRYKCYWALNFITKK